MWKERLPKFKESTNNLKIGNITSLVDMYGNFELNNNRIKEEK